MTMTIEDARRIERAPIEIGRQYTFFSTMQQEYEPPEKRIRSHTGKLVRVVRVTRDYDALDWADNPERMFNVRAANGFEFAAWETELNGFMCDTGQYFWPDATWGPEHDAFALSNERT